MFMILKTYSRINFLKNNFLLDYLFKFYSYFSTKFESLFFKKKKIQTELLSNGFKFYSNKINLNIKKYEITKVISNKYLSKYIFYENDIKEIIYDFFVKNNVSKLITAETGFEYSIDFITAYETKGISKKDLEFKWYANHWHKDKPFSKNTLKIILPLDEILENHGGIQIKQSENDLNFYKMTGKKEDFLVFFPNRCFHKAGNPKDNYVRKQLMFQLNPSNKWKLNSKVFLRQRNLEPKFPIFTYIFDKKVELEELI